MTTNEKTIVTYHTPSAGDDLAAEIIKHVEAGTAEVIANASSQVANSVLEFQELVTTGEWTEAWPDAEGKPFSRQVSGELWNAAIQAALGQSGRVILPKREKPYYLDRPISDCVLRNLTDIREFKLYDQPNLERRCEDRSAAVGQLRNLHFEHATFNHPGFFYVHADTTGLSIRDVHLNFPLPADYHLVEIGPLSATYKCGSEDPAKWLEVFAPDRDCTVRDLEVRDVRVADSAEDIPIDRLVKVITQKPNPDYPNYTPRGGKGRGIWLREEKSLD